MSPAKRPWEAMTRDERMEAVRPLLSSGLAPSTIAYRLGAKPSQVSGIATAIRRQDEAETNDELADDPGVEEGAGTEVAETSVPVALPAVCSDAVGTGNTGDEAGREPAIVAPPGEEEPDAIPSSLPNDEPPAPEVSVTATAPSEPLTEALPADWNALSRDEREAELVRLSQQGLTAAQIAASFVGASRNAIVGQLHRMAARGIGTPRGKRASKPRSAPDTKAAKPKATHSDRETIRPDSPDPLVENEAKATPAPMPALPIIAPSCAAPALRAAYPFDPLPGIPPVPFGSPGCKWPVDGLEGRGLLWCGLPRDTSERAEEPYCRHHVRIAYTAPAYRTRKAAAETKRVMA